MIEEIVIVLKIPFDPKNEDIDTKIKTVLDQPIGMYYESHACKKNGVLKFETNDV